MEHIQKIVFVMSFALIGIIILTPGLKVIIGRRPLLFEGKAINYLTGATLLACSVTQHYKDVSHFDVSRFNEWILQIIVSLCFLIMLYSTWRAPSYGYNILGMSHADFRQAFLRFLQKIGVSYEEEDSLIAIRDKSLTLKLHAFNNSIAVLGTDKDNFLKQIIAKMDDEFKSVHPKVTITSSLMLIVLGSIFLFGGVLVLLP